MIRSFGDTTTTTTTTCTKHQAAIALNNVAVSSMLPRGRYHEALLTMRDSIHLIKSCIADDHGNSNNDNSSSSSSSRRSDDCVDTTNVPPPTHVWTPEEIKRMLHRGYQRAGEVACSVAMTGHLTPHESSVVGTTTTNQQYPSPPQRPIHIQVLSSKQCLPSAGTIPHDDTGARSLELSPVLTMLDTVLSSCRHDHVNDPELRLFPMTIDDDTDDDDDTVARRCHAIDLYEYHSIMILYNFGILHQCWGLLDTNPVRRNAQKHTNDTSFAMRDNSDQYTRAATHVFRMIYQCMNQQVQPTRLYADLDGGNPVDGHPPPTHRQYLPMMILINYNMIQISCALQLPSECRYHSDLMHQLLQLVLAFEWNSCYPVGFQTATAA
jgi:hypothetical protein